VTRRLIQAQAGEEQWQADCLPCPHKLHQPEACISHPVNFYEELCLLGSRRALANEEQTNLSYQGPWVRGVWAQGQFSSLWGSRLPSSSFPAPLLGWALCLHTSSGSSRPPGLLPGNRLSRLRSPLLLAVTIPPGWALRFVPCAGPGPGCRHKPPPHLCVTRAHDTELL
jgi:hypothetical protein